MGAFYPVNKDLKNLVEKTDDFQNGNFSLWYNKYIPLTEKDSKVFKVSNAKGEESEAISYYSERYGRIAGKAKALLQRKHIEQIAFCQKFSQLSDFKSITIHAKLISPMITGIGQSHPSEISMVFDRNLGIPYIPASSIKGIVRFAHILSIILDNNGGNIKKEFKGVEEIDLSKYDIPDIFGGDKFIESEEKSYSYKGSVIFLDAYPLKVPDLKIDIMNPHYGDYYQDKEGKIPPVDYLKPVPIKFLTVKEEGEFIFRFIAKKEIYEKALKALERALTHEGVGAKTFLGYGLFEIKEYSEPALLLEWFKKYREHNMSEEEKREALRREFIEKVKNAKEKNDIDILFNGWQKNEGLKDDKDIAKLFLKKVKKKKSNGEYTYQYKEIAKILSINLDKKDENLEKKANNSSGNEKLKIEKQIDKYLSKGKISKREYKKIAEYKKKFPELSEEINKLKKMIG